MKTNHKLNLLTAAFTLALVPMSVFATPLPARPAPPMAATHPAAPVVHFPTGNDDLPFYFIDGKKKQ